VGQFFSPIVKVFSNPISNSSIPVTYKIAEGNTSDIARKHCISVVGDIRNFKANTTKR